MTGAIAPDPGHAGVVYEVNIELDAAIREAYFAWLEPHIRELCGLPGFLDAQLFEVSEPAADASRVRLCTHYSLRDQEALDAYLRDHAPRLRAEGESRFGGRFQASRRVMRPLSRG